MSQSCCRCHMLTHQRCWKSTRAIAAQAAASCAWFSVWNPRWNCVTDFFCQRAEFEFDIIFTGWQMFFCNQYMIYRLGITTVPVLVVGLIWCLRSQNQTILHGLNPKDMVSSHPTGTITQVNHCIMSVSLRKDHISQNIFSTIVPTMIKGRDNVWKCGISKKMSCRFPQHEF